METIKVGDYVESIGYDSTGLCGELQSITTGRYPYIIAFDDGSTYGVTKIKTICTAAALRWSNHMKFGRLSPQQIQSSYNTNKTAMSANICDHCGELKLGTPEGVCIHCNVFGKSAADKIMSWWSELTEDQQKLYAWYYFAALPAHLNSRHIELMHEADNKFGQLKRRLGSALVWWSGLTSTSRHAHLAQHNEYLSMSSIGYSDILIMWQPNVYDDIQKHIASSKILDGTVSKHKDNHKHYSEFSEELFMKYVDKFDNVSKLKMFRVLYKLVISLCVIDPMIEFNKANK